MLVTNHLNWHPTAVALRDLHSTSRRLDVSTSRLTWIPCKQSFIQPHIHELHELHKVPLPYDALPSVIDYNDIALAIGRRDVSDTMSAALRCR